MSEDKQTATEQTDVEAKPSTEEASAPENKQDDLDALLAEYEQQAGSSEQAKPKDTDTDATAMRLERLEAELSTRAYRDDIGKAIEVVRGDLPAEHFDNEFVDTWLNAEGRKDERVALAWANRNRDPDKYARVLQGLGRKFEQKYGKLRGHDEAATGDREAAADAIRRGANNAVPEGKPPDLSRMSEQEFQAYKDKIGL